MTTKTEKINLIKDILGTYSREGRNQYLFRCPACSHEKRKLSINFDKGLGKCWVCGYSCSNLGSLVKRFGTREQSSNWITLTGEIDLSSPKKDLFASQEEIKTDQIVNLPSEFISLTNLNLPLSSLLAKNYLEEREITLKDILYWKMGYCNEGEYRGRIIIPSFNTRGRVNYFIARAFDKGVYPKYKNPPVKRDIVFNELNIEWGKPIILVEGVFDAIVAGENSIPLLGSNINEKSDLFEKIIKLNPPEILLSLDADMQKKELTIIEKMLQYGVSVKKINIEPFADVGSMTKEIFQERKNEAARCSFHSSLLAKLRKV